jgi:DNA-binding NarL/FixJ family response regulator
MITGKLNILLIDGNLNKAVFNSAFEGLTIAHEVTTVANIDAVDNLLAAGAVVPDVIILVTENDRNGLKMLKELKKRETLQKTIFTILADCEKPEFTEQVFMAGANICLKKNVNKSKLIKSISVIASLCWQYITDGLDTEVFLLNLND